MHLKSTFSCTTAFGQQMYKHRGYQAFKDLRPEATKLSVKQGFHKSFPLIQFHSSLLI